MERNPPTIPVIFKTTPAQKEALFFLAKKAHRSMGEVIRGILAERLSRCKFDGDLNERLQHEQVNDRHRYWREE